MTESKPALAENGPRLDGKIALVTGSSRGIGRCVAQRLASAGALVVVTARSYEKPSLGQRAGGTRTVEGTLAETVALIEAAGGIALPLAADLEKPEQRDDLVARAAELAGGTVDILINNAGFADYRRFDELDLETFDRTVEHYFRVPFLLCKQAVPAMRANGAGWIVNVGSATALPPARPYSDSFKNTGELIYASCKAALHRFTQGLAAQLIDANIAVNVAGPSTAIRTPGASELISASYQTEDPAYLAETVLALCHLPAAERTGLITYSMHFPHHHKLTVRTLDGTGVLPDLPPPATARAGISPSGE